MFNWIRQLFKIIKKPDPEFLGWGQSLNRNRIFKIYRYTETTYQPARPDGSDRYGDFWSNDGNVAGRVGKDFKWVDPPEPHQHISSQVVLQVLIENGKITEEDIQAARTAAKLLNRTNP